MTEKKIKMNSIDDVKLFVSAATKAPFNIELKADEYVVDAKSILGIFSLNLANVITLQIHEDDEAAVKDFLQDISEYLI